MRCPYCKEEVKNVTMDASNNSYCSSCYSSLLNLLEIPALAKNLCFTQENMYLFTKSEKVFYSDEVNNSDAVSLCYEACQLGNPYAIVNIGYYLEKGIIKSDFKNDLKLALNCYLSVAVYDDDIRAIVEKMFNISIQTSSRFNITNNEANRKHVGTAIYNALCLLVNNDFSSIINSKETLIIALKKNLVKYDVEEWTTIDEEKMVQEAKLNENNYDSSIDQIEAFFTSIAKKNSEPLFSIQRTSVSNIISLVENFHSKSKLFNHFELYIWDKGRCIPLTNDNDFTNKMKEYEPTVNLTFMIFLSKTKKKKFSYVNMHGSDKEIKRSTVTFNPHLFYNFIKEGRNLEDNIGNYYCDDMIISKVSEIRKQGKDFFIKRFTH